jgi:hypothetical protein
MGEACSCDAGSAGGELDEVPLVFSCRPVRFALLLRAPVRRVRNVSRNSSSANARTSAQLAPGWLWLKSACASSILPTKAALAENCTE